MTKKVPVVEKILGANESLAEENRATLDEHKVFGINLMASPGAGKTSLIEQTLPKLAERYRVAVIDGDIATSIDADRAAEAGADIAVQVNTGGNCHLDAIMLKKGMEEIDFSEIDLLLVENVGNLVCPSNFLLGTHKSVLVASIPEGDDKPYKYPGMYRGVDALIINKIDLMPYIPFKMDYFRKGVEVLNPDLITFPLSCITQEGVDEWIDWIVEEVEKNKK
ncbi:MAG: hydrogenase nickel incorporation protein HypB [Chloroflexi bacterium]|nr:hydrogenase nickel incorporation protein HypB [Chloroflexota bacterium]